ncbi:hypothetical protein NECAME_17036 [Necator americanus]|uniref:Uncharacterized protein n=1 Tax=Necator americanus TaxID=51031 RepID=W2TSQ3_NECAM|nr:hypothetical protein NECAME_17036 [Necator americanus]ETN84694.1 hypothetical protein NECAME_17036 [Necator americanus]
MPAVVHRTASIAAVHKRSSRKACNREAETTRMTSSFDAYDLMSRSILSSIIGLKKKPRATHSTIQGSSSAIVVAMFFWYYDSFIGCNYDINLISIRK